MLKNGDKLLMSTIEFEWYIPKLKREKKIYLTVSSDMLQISNTALNKFDTFKILTVD